MGDDLVGMRKEWKKAGPKHEGTTMKERGDAALGKGEPPPSLKGIFREM